MSFASSISALPQHILTDILSRLPVKSIIHCRCVCKGWHHLLLHPEFAHMHLSRSPTNLVINHSGADTCSPDTVRLFQVKDEPDNFEFHHDPVMMFNLTDGIGVDAHLDFVGSVNGLICLCDFRNYFETFYVCNPITREYITVPQPQSLNVIMVYGFGFCPRTDQYKVVRIYQDEFLNPIIRSTKNISKVEVYTLGTGIWKSVGQLPVSVHLRTYTSTLHGNLHRLVSDDHNGFILCFDVDRELVELLEAPAYFGGGPTGLGVLGDRLCVCENTSENGMVFWVMKEYKVSDSWTKECTITPDLHKLTLSYETIHPLKVMKNGDILFLFWEDMFYCYNPKTNTLKEVDVCERYIQPAFDVASFLSLKKFTEETLGMF